MDKQKREEFYASLKAKLDDQETWPTVYLYKFIIPADNQKLAKVMELFGEGAQITTRESRKGNYLSVSAKEVMMSSGHVIETYQKAEHIEGLISL